MPLEPEVLLHVEKLYNVSECRTPLICCSKHGDPLISVQTLAKVVGSTVWCITPVDPKSDQNAVDYLEVGLSNGDWLYLPHFNNASEALMRHLGRELYTVKPDPKNFPRRELFRLWLVVDEPFDLGDDGVLPRVLTQHAILGWHDGVAGVHLESKEKTDPGVIQQLANSPVKAPRDPAYEEDNNPANKITGPWFHRSVERYYFTTEDKVMQTVESIFDYIERGDVEKVVEICASNTVDLNAVQKGGLSPLFWAIMCDDIAIVRVLLENGADPNMRRPSNSMPPMFMSLDDPAMLQLLLDFGADLDALFEGHSLEDHPDTAPTIIAYLQKLKD